MRIFDLDAFGAGPVLCAHLFHTLTPRALDQPHANAVDWLKMCWAVFSVIRCRNLSLRS